MTDFSDVDTDHLWEVCDLLGISGLFPKEVWDAWSLKHKFHHFDNVLKGFKEEWDDFKTKEFLKNLEDEPPREDPIIAMYRKKLEEELGEE